MGSLPPPALLLLLALSAVAGGALGDAAISGGEPLAAGWIAATAAAAAAAADPSTTARVAVIGDFGQDGTNEARVATLVKGWEAAAALTAVVTTGDNNYPSGAASTIANNIGKHYGWAITPEAATNRFWPLPGNHDWGNAGCSNPLGLNPYLDYFPALGRKRYYEVRVGPDLHFFMLDSDCNEPQGYTSGSQQAVWLQGALAASNATFKIVALHHAPYSSGGHGSNPSTQWRGTEGLVPYEAWGADAVLAGHDHDYERFSNPKGLAGRAGFPYIVNGIGGASLYTFGATVPSSQVRYNSDYGAQLLTSRRAADGAQAEVDFAMYSAAGTLVDCWRITKALTGGTTTYGACTTPTPPPGPPPPPGPTTYSLFTRSAAGSGAAEIATWRYLKGGKGRKAWLDPAAPGSWVTAGFPDSAWKSGPSPLGYGSDQAWGTTLADNSGFASGVAYYYFRAALCLTADVASKTENVTLRLMSDNGARVYINSAVVADDLTADHDVDPTWNTVKQLPAGTLVAGTNIIAVAVSNTPGSSDTGFNLDLVYSADSPLASQPAACPPVTVSLLSGAAVPTAGPQGPRATWRYMKSPGSTVLKTSGADSWVTWGHADAEWAKGLSPLGAGGSGIEWATPLDPAAPADTTGRAYFYFRLKLCLPPAVYAELSAKTATLRVMSDDGARVYINKKRLVNDLTKTHTASQWNTEKALAKGSPLVAGDNIIAVVVSNARGSPDVGFDLDIMFDASVPLSGPLVC